MASTKRGAGRTRAVATKAQAPARSARGKSLVPSRGDRIAKKLGSTFEYGKHDAKKALHEVTVVADRQPVEHMGSLIAINESGYVFRHKIKSGSKKTQVRTYPHSDVIEQVGAVNKPGMIRVMQPVQQLLLKNQLVSYKDGIVVATDANSGEVTRLNQAVPGVTVNVYAVE